MTLARKSSRFSIRWYGSAVERLALYVLVDEGTGCHNWLGPKTACGYGRIQDGKRRMMAHRFAYEQAVGPIPAGLQIDHLCRNRSCCNPAHLEPVTSAENSRRSDNPAALNSRKTECKNGHPFDIANTYVDKQGGRKCRACHALSGKKRRARARA